MSKIICPACGSDKVEEKLVLKTFNEPFCDEYSIEIKEYVCNTCDFEGDFLKENDEKIEKALSKLKTNCVSNILNNLTQTNYSLASIERALNLPQRTLAKWKNGENNPSASGITLLRFLNVFPWLIEVAENNYDYYISNKIHATMAVNQIMNMFFYQNNTLNKGEVVSSQQTFVLYISNSTIYASEDGMTPGELGGHLQAEYKVGV